MCLIFNKQVLKNLNCVLIFQPLSYYIANFLFQLDQFSSPSKFIELQISEAEGSVQDDLAEAEIELDTSRPCPQCDLDLSNEDYFEHLKTSHSNIRSV